MAGGVLGADPSMLLGYLEMARQMMNNPVIKAHVGLPEDWEWKKSQMPQLPKGFQQAGMMNLPPQGYADIPNTGPIDWLNTPSALPGITPPLPQRNPQRAAIQEQLNNAAWDSQNIENATAWGRSPPQYSWPEFAQPPENRKARKGI